MKDLTQMLGCSHRGRMPRRLDMDSRYLCSNVFGGDDSAEEASDAQVKANRDSIAFQKEIFNRQLQLQQPQLNVGNQALGYLGSLYGFDANYNPNPIQPFGDEEGDKHGEKWAKKHFSSGQVHCAVRSKGGQCVTWAPGGGQTQIQGQQTPAAGTSGTGAPFQQRSFNDLLMQDPGYQFRLQEGQKALDRQAAAGGRLYSGGQLKAAQRYGQDFASTEFGNAYNRLAALAGLQQTGTSGASNALGNLGSSVGQGLQNIGDARASGYINAANQKQSGFNSLLNAGIAGAGIYSIFK